MRIINSVSMIALGMSDVDEDSNAGEPGVDEPLFEGYEEVDVSVRSNLADGATIDVNGTALHIRQSTPHVPVVVEISVEDEETPVGAINTASGRTVTLGGVSEDLASQVEAIKERPIEEIDDALDELAYRLNPSGREKPESLSDGEETET